MGRLETVTDPRNGSTTYNYDPVGVVTSMVQPNGISTLYEYDLRYRVTGIQSTFVGFQYSYDAAGNRIAATEMVDGVINHLSWTYDAANRLTSETRRDMGNAVIDQRSYTYDAVGNRMNQRINGLTTLYSYNPLDQLLTSTPALGATTSYAYDGRGNRISATNGTNITSFSYDALDRLIGVSLPTGMTAGYRYDADGRRVETLLDGQVTRYLWDEASRYGDVILETNGNGEQIASYVLGGMNILSQTREGDTSYFSQDALGSTRALTDASGSLTDAYRYNAFGEMFAQTGSTLNNYLYAGQQYDTATGLYSMRARYYDPSVGRFLIRDTADIDFENPIELNRYAYTANNPVNATDPSGHMAIVDYGLRLAKAGIRGAATGALSGYFGAGLFYIVASTGFCGDRLQDWALSLTPLQRIEYLAQSAAIGAAFGGIVGIAGAISPAVLGYTNAVIGGIGLGTSVYDGITNGWNPCNVLGAGLSVAGGLGGGLGGRSFTIRIPNFERLLGVQAGAGALALQGSTALVTVVVVSEAAATALRITNVAVLAAAAGGGGGGDGGGGTNRPRFPRENEVEGFANRTQGRPPTHRNNRQVFGIYEYRQLDGRLYVGSARLQTLLKRLRQHQNPNDAHPLNPDPSMPNVVWTEIRGGGRPAAYAEQIRILQLQSMPEMQGQLANALSAADIRQLVGWWKSSEAWRQRNGWPDWLYPPDNILSGSP